MSPRSCAVRACPPAFVNVQEIANAPSTSAAVPIALGDGGRCGGQNSSSASANSVGWQVVIIVEERPPRRQATLDAAPAAPHDSSALRKRMLLNKDHLPTCVSACVAW